MLKLDLSIVQALLRSGRQCGQSSWESLDVSEDSDTKIVCQGDLWAFHLWS